MNIYEQYHRKAKEFFENEKRRLNEYYGHNIAHSDEVNCKRLQFIDSLFDLLFTVVTKEHLVFCEEKPKEPDVVHFYELASEEVFVNQEDEESWVTEKYGIAMKGWTELHNVWQQRKDQFQPLFLGEIKGEWFNYDGNYWTTDGENSYFIGIEDTKVYDCLEQGLQLNPNHPLIKQIKYFKEVSEVEVSI